MSENHFRGTAAYYADYRPRYPAAAWDLVLDGLVGTGAALDLGCGPGTATLDLAERFDRVTAIDQDADMIAEARRSAATNVNWRVGTAESLEAADGSFDLITIASAFHWMDRPAVARTCASLVRPGGRLAVLGNPTPLMETSNADGVGAAIGAVQRKWFAEDYYVFDIEELARPEVVLEQNGYREVSVHYIPQPQQWDVERFLGFLRSTSSRPDQRLGERFAEFAADMEAAIREVSPSGEWTLEIPVEVILAEPALR